MTLPGLAGSFHFLRATFGLRSQKLVTPLLLFGGENFVAVNDELIKKSFSPGRIWIHDTRILPLPSSFEVPTQFAIFCNYIVVLKKVRIMMSLI